MRRKIGICIDIFGDSKKKPTTDIKVNPLKCITLIQLFVEALSDTLCDFISIAVHRAYYWLRFKTLEWQNMNIAFYCYQGLFLITLLSNKLLFN